MAKSSISYFRKRLDNVASLFEAHQLKREYAKFVDDLTRRNRLDEIQYSTIPQEIDTLIERYDTEIIEAELAKFS